MAKEFGVFVKVFSQEKYREDFLNGKFYMNTIKYFKEFEEEASNNIGDKNEAITAWLQPENIQITFDVNSMHPFTIHGKDIADPVAIRTHCHDNYNVLCLTHLHSHGIDMSKPVSYEESEMLKKYFNLPSESANLGDYAVIIYDIPAFIERLTIAAKKMIDTHQIFSFKADKVKYYDKDKTLSLDDGEEAVFHKQSDYKHQSEYRVCIDRRVPYSEPLIFDMENIKDISLECLTSEINSKLL